MYYILIHNIIYFSYGHLHPLWEPLGKNAFSELYLMTDGEIKSCILGTFTVCNLSVNKKITVSGLTNEYVFIFVGTSQGQQEFDFAV